MIKKYKLPHGVKMVLTNLEVRQPKLTWRLTKICRECGREFTFRTNYNEHWIKRYTVSKDDY